MGSDSIAIIAFQVIVLAAATARPAYLAITSRSARARTAWLISTILLALFSAAFTATVWLWGVDFALSDSGQLTGESEQVFWDHLRAPMIIVAVIVFIAALWSVQRATEISDDLEKASE